MMDHIDGLTSPCPKCGCKPEKIRYYNSGPIVRLVCPDCSYHVYDYQAWEQGLNGIEGLVEYWNKILPI